MKICNKCNIEKPLNEFYSYERESKKKGKVTYYFPYCKECSAKKSVKWYTDNPERFKEFKRKQNAKPKNKAIVKERSRRFSEQGYYLKWQRENKDKVKQYSLQREAHKKHSITKEQWEYCKEYFNNSCAYCGIPIEEHFNKYKGVVKLTDFHKEHVDHEGSNTIENCVPSCKSCNSTKRKNKLEEWYNIDNPIFSEVRLNKIYQWLNYDVKVIM